MIELLGYILIFAICFIVLSPFLILFIKTVNRFPQTTYVYPSSQSVRVQKPVFVDRPAVTVQKKPKTNKPINTSSSIPQSKSTIKEFTMPDGSKIAIDCAKVEMEEKQVFE